MTTPTDRKLRMYIYDMLRYKYRLNLKNITSKTELIKQVRRRLGLRKFQKAVGKKKSFLALLKKSDFWHHYKREVLEGFQKVKSRRGVYVRSQPRRWTATEERLLYRLKVFEGLRGKRLAKEFNRQNFRPRTYSSIVTKASRLKTS